MHKVTPTFPKQCIILTCGFVVSQFSRKYAYKYVFIYVADIIDNDNKQIPVGFLFMYSYKLLSKNFVAYFFFALNCQKKKNSISALLFPISEK